MPNSTDWNKDTTNSVDWSKQTIQSTYWTGEDNNGSAGSVLLQSGDTILMETGDQLQLE